MLFFFKYRENHQYLEKLSKIPQRSQDIKTLYSPKEFFYSLLDYINSAKERISLVALYLDYDQGGKKILQALFKAKKNNKNLKIKILVDLHRAQRGKIGSSSTNTNSDWYYSIAQEHKNIEVPIYGIPINTREALGVLHLKGCIIDSSIIYSGANLNNVYFHQENKYRYDRYKIIKNKLLSDSMQNYIDIQLLCSPTTRRLDFIDIRKNIGIIKNDTRIFRKSLKKTTYRYSCNTNSEELSITPLVGLGKKNLLNKTIHYLISSTKEKVILCTPYFNIHTLLVHDIMKILRHGKQVEIIVGDKTANDFYFTKNQKFKIVGIIPYLYEINLRNFLKKFQCFINNKQLFVRLWKDKDNSFHIKGVWVDNTWQLITGHNLNHRSWRLDLENALLIHDPRKLLQEQYNQELRIIRTHTNCITHFSMLEKIEDYPIPVKKLILRLRRIRIDLLINKIL